MAEIPDLKPGDKVRITLEGVLTHQNDKYLALRMPSGMWSYFRKELDDFVAVEKVEPEAEGGCVYEDAAGDLYYRMSTTSQWRYVYNGQLMDHDFPKRPLRKLVPEEDQ